jgi:hypothetical protein
MNPTFAAAPVTQAYSPAKTFNSEVAAFAYAESAAATFGIAYVVWQRSPRLKKLRTFTPDKQASVVQAR